MNQWTQTQPILGWKPRPVFPSHRFEGKQYRRVNGHKSYCELMVKTVLHRITCSMKIKTHCLELGRNTQIRSFRSNHQTVNTEPLVSIMKIIIVTFQVQDSTSVAMAKEQNLSFWLKWILLLRNNQDSYQSFITVLVFPFFFIVLQAWSSKCRLEICFFVVYIIRELILLHPFLDFFF